MKAAAKSMPLFPRSKRGELVTLIVRRFENERWVQAASAVPASELPDRNAVKERFGGGQYDVIGRDEKRIHARSRFVIEGEPLPLGASPSTELRKGARKGEMRFATADGERQALVFRLLNQGLAHDEITERTGIEALVVRAIYLEWITPLGMSPPTSPEQVLALSEVRAAKLRARELAGWEAT